MKKYLFIFYYCIFSLFIPTIGFAFTGYTRTPSGSTITTDSIVVSVDYNSGDSSGLLQGALILFDQSGDVVDCINKTVTTGGSGTVGHTFTDLPDGAYYYVSFPLMTSGAPTFNTCGTLAGSYGNNHGGMNSMKDGGGDLETGAPAFIIDTSGGGSGTSTTATSTGMTFHDQLFVANILILVLSFPFFQMTMSWMK